MCYLLPKKEADLLKVKTNLRVCTCVSVCFRHCAWAWLQTRFCVCVYLANYVPEQYLYTDY